MKQTFKTFKYFGRNTKKHNIITNQVNQPGSNLLNNNINKLLLVNEDEILIDEIYKNSDIFGEDIFGLINFFTFKSDEKKIIHMLDGLNIVDLNDNGYNSNFQKEFYFENFSKFFKKIENYCSKGDIPHEFDIFTTKHSNSKSFDVLINIFTRKSNFNESDLESSKI